MIDNDGVLTIARVLVVIGIALLVIGGGIFLLARLGVPMGRLPGDFRFQMDGLTCFFPLGSAILISLVLSLILTVLFRLLNK
jgi:hypothetical protein